MTNEARIREKLHAAMLLIGEAYQLIGAGEPERQDIPPALSLIWDSELKKTFRRRRRKVLRLRTRRCRKKNHRKLKRG